MIVEIKFAVLKGACDFHPLKQGTTREKIVNSCNHINGYPMCKPRFCPLLERGGEEGDKDGD
jgi:hypothetical protein